ncbi:MAG: helix-turn-helix transcriptional regulator [Candidatus Thorarchaeota archaeon]|jgi:uncharacterized membrane protein
MKDVNRYISALSIGILVVGLIGGVHVLAQEDLANDTLLDPFVITAKIQANGPTTMIIDARIINIGTESLQSVDIRIDSLDVEFLSATVRGDSVDLSMTKMERHTMVSLQPTQEILSGESAWVHLELKAKDLQSPLEPDSSLLYSHGSMTYYVRPHAPVYNFTFIAILPDHASLSHDSVVPLFPQSNDNFTDGVSMAFGWFSPSLLPGQENVFIVRYQIPITSEIDNPGSLLLMGVIGVLGVLLGLGGAIFAPRLLKRLRRIGAVQYAGITKEESMIIEAIQLKGGSCSQKDLYRQLDISESKLSIVLGGLEERGLVSRIRQGRENVVQLLETSK